MKKLDLLGVVGGVAVGVCALTTLVVKKVCDARALRELFCHLYDEATEEDDPFEAEYIIEFEVEPLDSADCKDKAFEQKKGS